jgi:hypothetical protein
MTQKVTVKPQRTAATPSEEVVRAATEEFSVTDARGRVITLKKPGVLAQYRLVEAMGSEAARNEVYMGMVLPIIFVTSIDGLHVPSPTNKAQIEGLIVRLDDDGIAAVAAGVQEHFGAQDPEADREALKK